MTRKTLILLAGAGSAALLLGALAFQYLGGMAPCKLCLWQRWPHGAAIAVALLALAVRGRAQAALCAAGALAALASAAVGLYHAGVEQGWWQGPTSCSSGPVSGLDTDDLVAQIMAAPMVRCDDIPWQMLGLSMAGWNALLSGALVIIWIAALRRT